MAAGGARAAGGEAADHRVLGPEHARRLRANGSPLLCSGCASSAGSRAAPSRSSIAWAEGRSERFAEIAAEFVRLKVDVIVTYGNPSGRRGKAGDIGHPDRVRGGGGPGRHRPRRESGATGRQRHRPVEPGDRSCWQATRTFARGCPRSPPVGDHGQCRQSRRRAGDGRGSGSGPHAWPRGRHARNPASGGYRARLRGAQGPRRGALCRADPLVNHQPGSHQHLGAGRATADDVLLFGSTSKREV